LANWCAGGALLVLALGVSPAARGQAKPGSADPTPIAGVPAPGAAVAGPGVPLGPEPTPCFMPPPSPSPLPPGPPTLVKEKNELSDETPNAFGCECPPPWSPHLEFTAGVYIFNTIRVTNNQAFNVTTFNPALLKFMPNPALSIADPRNSVPTGLSGVPSLSGFSDFTFQTGVAPVLTLKLMNGEGWGLRVRWWQMEQSARSQQAINGDTSAGIVPFGGSGNRIVQSATPFAGFGLTSPDTSRLLDPLLAPGVPPQGAGDGDINNGPAQGVAQSLLANSLPEDVMTFSDTLKVQVWDLEATRDFVDDHWAFHIAAGARYAYVSQLYESFRVHAPGFFNLPDPEVTPGTVEDFVGVNVTRDDTLFNAGDSFAGVGPTLLFGVQYQIQPLWGIIAFANVRGSILFGRQKQTAFQLSHFAGSAFQSANNDAGADPNPLDYLPISFNGATAMQNETRRDQTVPQWEYEAGVQWGRDLGAAGFFVSAAVTGQQWFGVGSATSQSGDLRLFGIKADVGFDY
jgi:hypothetical protein